MDLIGQNILIIGLGKTGIATARFLAKQKARIVVTDQKTEADITDTLAEIRNEDISMDIASYDVSALHNIDMVIPSPGVAYFTHPSTRSHGLSELRFPHRWGGIDL